MEILFPFSPEIIGAIMVTLAIVAAFFSWVAILLTEMSFMRLNIVALMGSVILSVIFLITIANGNEYLFALGVGGYSAFLIPTLSSKQLSKSFYKMMGKRYPW